MKKAMMVLVVLAVSAFGLRVAGAHDGPAPPPPECDGADTAVLVDASSEPDLYAAFLLAGVLDTECIVDAGDRDGALPNASQGLLAEPTLVDGYTVGGSAAVPSRKLVAGLSWRRAGGVDRWETLRVIGAAAADPSTLPSVATGSSGAAEGESSGAATPTGWPQVAAEHGGGYERDNFGDHHASDLCQTATVGFFTGLAFGTIGCDVDHVVSLKEAWESGAHTWTASQRTAFARDRDNLRPTLSCVNRSKSDRDAAEWPRPVASGTCEGYQATQQGCQQFKAITLAVKHKHALTIDQAEQQALQDWDTRCANHPQTPTDAADDTPDQTQSDEPSGAGCTHWHAGHPKHTHYAGETGKHTHQSSSRTKCGWLF